MKITRIALYLMLFLCAMLILVGLAMLGSSFPIVLRLLLSALCVGFGAAMGAIFVVLLQEE